MAIECAFSFSTFIANIAGVLIGAGVGFCSAVHVSNRNARHTAAAKLRGAFAPIVSKMRLAAIDTTIKPEDELPNAFPSMSAAIEEFRPFICNKDRDAFQRAWENYFLTGGSVRFYDYYIGKDCDELFQTRIHDILKFTEPSQPLSWRRCWLCGRCET